MAKAKATKAKATGKADALRATREAQAAAADKPSRAAQNGAVGAAIRNAGRAKGKGRGKRQAEIPGFERQADDTLDPLCLEYIRASDAQSAAQKEATELKATISQTMSAQARKIYTYVDGEESRIFRFKEAKLSVEKVKRHDVDAKDGAE